NIAEVDGGEVHADPANDRDGAVVDHHHGAVGEASAVAVGVADRDQPDATASQGTPGLAVPDGSAGGDFLHPHEGRGPLEDGAQGAVDVGLAGRVDAGEGQAGSNHVQVR